MPDTAATPPAFYSYSEHQLRDLYAALAWYEGYLKGKGDEAPMSVRATIYAFTPPFLKWPENDPAYKGTQ